MNYAKEPKIFLCLSIFKDHFRTAPPTYHTTYTLLLSLFLTAKFPALNVAIIAQIFWKNPVI